MGVVVEKAFTTDYAPIVAASLGVVTHLGFFHRGEHFLFPLRYLQAAVLVNIVAVVAQSHYNDIPVRTAIREMLPLTGCFLAGIYTSLLTYRIFFNPLNEIPGPWLARITKLDTVLRCVGKLDHHKQLLKRHEKYGKFLRIGPNDVSVTDPKGVEVTSAPESKCTKSTWYQHDHPVLSMHTTRDRKLHDRRRRIWAPAFSDKALRGYESRIQKVNHALMDKIEEHEGQPMDVSYWFKLYGFDVMGDLGFGESFNMVETGKQHWAVKLLSDGMDLHGLHLPSWLFRTLFTIPGAAADYHKFINYCSGQLDKRMKNQGKQANPDIAHTLIEQYMENDAKIRKTQLPMLRGDSRLIIVAGSETTAATLIYVFYYLAAIPGVLKKLRDEVTPLLDENGLFEDKDIKDAKYLDGVIHEVLRLNPPVPSGVTRKTPEEGIMIGETFVPGGTNIQMPQFVMGHDESIYMKCEEFIPERWYSKSEMIKDRDAFAPFSIGPFSCIGRNLAYMEVRMLTVQIIMKFDVSLAPGEKGAMIFDQSVDHFTMGVGKLDLVFKKRKSE